MAFDNFEDSLHVYYLILPPLSIHSYLLHHKHLDMLQKSTFPASPKQKQGFYIKQFCATRDYLLQTMWDLHLCRKLMEFTCFWGAAGSVLLCNRWGAVNGFNSLAIKCLLYFTSLTINTSWSMPADFLNGRGHTLICFVGEFLRWYPWWLSLHNPQGEKWCSPLKDVQKDVQQIITRIKGPWKLLLTFQIACKTPFIAQHTTFSPDIYFSLQGVGLSSRNHL